MLCPFAARQRLRAAATLLGTLTLTLALLAGMPYVLWQAVGIPWPEHVSSIAEVGDRLLQPVSDPLMIELLAVVGWVCWAAFTFTVIRESLWYAAHLPNLLRDRTAHPTHVAALSVKGSLAALCIGTLFMAALGLWRPQAAGAEQPALVGELRPQIAATAPVAPSPGSQAASHAATPATPAQSPVARTRAASPVPPTDAEAIQYIEYVVVTGDTLWDIAHTHLGDALKWPRIYKLNKDRIQSDGGRLTDPDLIVPGWRLALPVPQTAPAPLPSATAAPAPYNPPAQPAPTMPPQPTPAQNTVDGGTGRAEHGPAAPNKREETAAGQMHAKSGPAAIDIGTASLIGITVAAGLLAARRYWYWHHNRLREPDSETEVPALSPLVDKAAQAAHAATLPHCPDAPEALVRRRIPPQKPRSTDAVTVGVSDNTEIPLDALAVTGGCAWSGPGAEGAARALLTGILTAAERQRPGPPHVTAVVAEDMADRLLPGLPPQFTALTQSSDTADAIRLAEQHLLAHARARHEPEPSATGRTTAHAAAEADPGTLVLLAAPDAVHSGQLEALAARSHPQALIVLTLNALLPGSERWHIADDGTTTRPHADGQHPGRLRLFHLSPEAGRSMTEFLLGAHGQRPHLRILPTPDSRRHDHPSETMAEPSPEPDSAPAHPYTADGPRPAQTKPVRLHVLGPITLYVRGKSDPVGTSLRPEVHEFLALLAAHPSGLLTTDIAEKLHLDPESDQNALKNLRRAVRRALRAATGITAQEFILRQGELHKLHPELVETDLADFICNLKKAFPAPGVQKAECDALSAVREALAHYRGPFAQGGDYLWVDAIREHLAMKATDAALRLAHRAEHATEARERDAVLTLLEHLATAHPDHERLAQHAIRLYQAAGRHDAARHTYTRLKRHLADLGLEPDLATQVLAIPRAHSRQGP
ncbi:BTAD domain-containing putative transcriptional regulator [Streptomyces sp. CBMA152]|uniref:BTAD domain-containing putative transcriptional regulator n=1 Tax=Streptomyces sp. CBMA152 TaxID=1896312 RepID=UPI00166133B2|nr:BTAD domain-containing putative transcriptional regulator [Streptomyces sp. CBMA152]MBD0741667.1 transcriptional regulator [Streptomyces sp. CBMA152]